MEHVFQLLNTKTECKRTHKQAKTEGCCTKGMAEHVKGRETVFGALDLTQSLTAKDFYLVINVITSFSNQSMSIY